MGLIRLTALRLLVSYDLLLQLMGRTDDEDFVIGGGRRVVYGTDDGVYVSDLRDPNKDPARVLA